MYNIIVVSAPITKATHRYAHTYAHIYTIQYNTIIILSEVLYNYIGNAMLINNNYVIIMFIDCPGAMTLFSTRAVCVMCCAYAVAVSYTVRVRTSERRETRYKNPLVKPPVPTRICTLLLLFTHIVCIYAGT